MQTAEPHHSPAVRLAILDETASSGTAVCRTISNYAYDWNVLPPGGGYPELSQSTGTKHLCDDPNCFPVILTRDPVVRYITREYMPDTEVLWPYVIILADMGYEGAQMIFNGNPSSFPIAYAIWDHAGWAAYGDYHPGGVVAGKRVIWIDASPERPAHLNVEMTVTGDGANLTLELKLHTAEDAVGIETWNQRTNVPAGHSDVTMRIDFSGYYSLTGYTGETDVLRCSNVVISLVGQCQAVYRHNTMPEFQTRTSQIREMRILGSGLKLSNNCPNWQKGGIVLAAQLGCGEAWWPFLASQRVLTDANARITYEDNNDKGLYAFFKPTPGPQGSAFAMRQVFNTTSAGLSTPDYRSTSSMPNFKPFCQEGWLVARVQPPLTTGIGTGAHTTFLSVYTIAEFTTRDQFFDLETPWIGFAAQNAYLEALHSMEQFMENPSHMEDIKRNVGRALRFLVTHGPTALKLASTFLPFFA